MKHNLSKHLPGLVLGGVTALVLVFFYLSIVIMVLISFSEGRATQWPPPGWTLDWYIKLFGSANALEAVTTSIVLAIATSVVATALGTLTAFALTNLKLKRERAMRTMVYLPMIISPLIIGVGLLLYFHMIDLALGYFTVLVAHTVRAFPFTVLIVSTSFLGVKSSILEAAQDLGASKISTFRRVIVPLVAPGIVASMLIAFTVSFDEIIVTYFVIGGGVSTVPTYIMEQLAFSISPELNALTTAVLIASSIVVTVSIWLQNRIQSNRT